MLPGLDGTGLVFEPLLQLLPESIDAAVVRYPVDRVMTFQEHVDFAREQFPENKPFVLLAESFSGPVGLQLLAKPPKNLVGVILVATFARYPSPFLLDAANYLPQNLLLKFFSTNLLTRFFCLGSASKASVNLFRRALATVKQKVLSSRLQILAELPPPPDSTFPGPCLYLQASHDRMVPPRALLPLQKHLPQLQVKQISGPHIILLGHPDKGAQLIIDFIETVTDGQ